MRQFVMDRAQEGKRVDRWLSIAAPALPMGLRQKYLRLKRVKVNGKRTTDRALRLCEGDVLTVYISDEYLERPTAENAFLALGSHLRQKRTTAADINFFCKHICMDFVLQI